MPAKKLKKTQKTIETPFLPTGEPLLDGNERKYILDCFKRDWISAGGKFSQILEEKFAKWVGTKYAVTCSSGTAAIHLALASLEIGSGDEVIIPDMNIICSASMSILCGAKPVLVDVDEFWCIDPAKIEEKITKKTKAIIPVHMYGNPANMGPILRIAKKYKIAVIEDACAAIGATYKGKEVGSVGDIGCFSLYTSKTITAGEGGMVVTNNEEIANMARLLKSQAFEKPRFIHRYLGFNYRMTDIQAAIACAQLEKIDRKVARRREIAKIYNKLFEGVDEITLPKDPSWGKSSFWMYSILVNDSFGRSRDEIIDLLHEKGIGSERFFYPMSKQPIFIKGGDRRYPDISGKYTISWDVSARGLYLPSGLGITKAQQERVVKELLSLRVKSAKLIKPTFIREDQRGLFIEAINGSDWKNISYGEMKKGAVMGNHYHKKTELFFYLTKGIVKIDVINIRTKELETFNLKANEGVIFKTNYAHAIRFLEDSSFVMGKSLEYNPQNPDTYSFEVPEVK